MTKKYQNKTNILYISHSEQIGGAEIVLFNIVNKLAKNDSFAVHLICPKHNQKYLQNLGLLNNKNVKVVFYPLSILTLNPQWLLRILKSTFIFPYFLNKYCENNKINLVQVNNVTGLLYTRTLSKKIPLIVHCHGHETKLKLVLLKLLQHRANKIICVSQAVVDVLNNGGIKANKVSLLYNGFNFKPLNPHLNIFRELAIESSFYKNKLIIATISRIIPMKGQHLFIEAAKELLKKYPNLVFCIIGEAWKNDLPYLNKLKAFVAENHLSKQIIFTGYKNNIPDLIPFLNIVVLCSTKFDSLPTTLIEAMAYGSCVISTDVGGVREIIQDRVTGLIVQKNSSKKLANAMEKIITSDKKALIKMRQTAKKNTLDKFSEKKFINGFIKAYQELVH